MGADRLTRFCREALRNGVVWHLLGEEGAPAAATPEDGHAIPFWSSRERAERLVAQSRMFAGYAVDEVALPLWRERWLPNLAADGFRIGVNWTGRHVEGIDVHPREVADLLSALEASAARR